MAEASVCGGGNLCGRTGAEVVEGRTSGQFGEVRGRTRLRGGEANRKG